MSCDFLNNEQVLYILLCFNDNYALSAGVDIIYLIENNKNKICFHIFKHVPVTEYIINDQYKADFGDRNILGLKR